MCYCAREVSIFGSIDVGGVVLQLMQMGNHWSPAGGGIRSHGREAMLILILCLVAGSPLSQFFRFIGVCTINVNCSRLPLISVQWKPVSGLILREPFVVAHYYVAASVVVVSFRTSGRVLNIAECMVNTLMQSVQYSWRDDEPPSPVPAPAT